MVGVTSLPSFTGVTRATLELFATFVNNYVDI
jgi:hypothetical protein